jgi:hypothetical protein
MAPASGPEQILHPEVLGAFDHATGVVVHGELAHQTLQPPQREVLFVIPPSFAK